MSFDQYTFLSSRANENEPRDPVRMTHNARLKNAVIVFRVPEAYFRPKAKC